MVTLQLISGGRSVHGAQAPDPTVAPEATPSSRPLSDSEVSERLHAEQLEKRIRAAGWLMEQAYAKYELTNCFGDIGEAHRYEREMRELIAQRSPEQVRRMEEERGLT